MNGLTADSIILCIRTVNAGEDTWCIVMRVKHIYNVFLFWITKLFGRVEQQRLAADALWFKFLNKRHTFLSWTNSYTVLLAPLMAREREREGRGKHSLWAGRHLARASTSDSTFQQGNRRHHTLPQMVTYANLRRILLCTNPCDFAIHCPVLQWPALLIPPSPWDRACSNTFKRARTGLYVAVGSG